jgi:hypothetical protein
MGVGAVVFIVCKITYVQNVFLNRLDVCGEEYCGFEVAIHQYAFRKVEVIFLYF